MVNKHVFKKITNEDIYKKLCSIEEIAKKNSTHIKIIWVLIIIMLSAIIGGKLT